MSQDAHRHEVKLTLPMGQDFELVATEAASAYASICGCSEDAVDEIKMAVIEACINAFEHSKARHRKIEISIGMEQDRLVIVIEDRGQGFRRDPVEAGPRTTPEGRKRGFGLAIIRAMMDDVKVQTTKRGTRIEMVKLKPGAVPATKKEGR